MKAKPGTRRPSRRASRIAGLIVIGILAASILVPLTIFLTSSENRDGFSYYGDKIFGPKPGYDFTLTDQDGKPFRLDSLRGKVVLLTFGFAHCANICPTTLGNLAAVHRQLPPDVRSKVKVVFVSVDPERDTPRVMKDYMAFFDADFIGVTGTDAEIATAAKGYGVFYQRSPASADQASPAQPHGTAADEDYSIDHSAYTYLIDPRGRMSVLYSFQQMNGTDRLVRDIEHILAQKAL
jgi:protein SCO1/2